MMEEDDWVRAMEAEPANAAIMGAFADWLDERNDPRAGLFRMLWEGGKVGNIGGHETGSYPYYSVGRNDIMYVCSGLWDATHDHLGGKFYELPFFNLPLTTARLAMATAWAEADEETRERWRIETLNMETANE